MRASISVHQDALRYMEVDGEANKKNLHIIKTLEFPISNNGDWLVAMKELHSQVKKFPSVVFGVPKRETVIRIVEYPRMPIADIKQALIYDFDKHFTWTYASSVVDVCEVESPVNRDGRKMSVLVVACQKEIVDKILDVSKQMNIKIISLAPMSNALLRTVMGTVPAETGAWYSFNAEPDSLHFALVYKDNGIFYHSVLLREPLDIETQYGLSSLSDEIQKVMGFIGNHFRGIEPKTIKLSGLLATKENIATMIETTTQIPTEIIDVYKLWGISGKLPDCFESAFGLCMRNRFAG